MEMVFLSNIESAQVPENFYASAWLAQSIAIYRVDIATVVMLVARK